MNWKYVAVVFVFELIFLAAIVEPTSLATANSASSTAPPIVWEHAYSTGDSSSIRSMIQTTDGDYALAGMGMEIAVGIIDFWVVKVDSSGNQQWNMAGFDYDSTMNTNWGGANSIVQTSDGGFALAGGTSNSSYLVKLDSQGNVQWRQSYTGIDVSSLITVNDGDYIMAGSSNGDFWLAKVNSTGEIQWSHTYGGEAVSYCTSMVQTSDGGYALAGFVETSTSESNALLIKTDSLGNMLWNQTYNGPSGYFEANSIIQTSDGGYVLAGGSNTVFMIKTNSDGKLLWNQTYGELGGEVAWSVIQTSDGGYALACGGFSGNLVKTDSDGNLQWEIACNGTVYSVLQTDDGGYTFAVSNGVGDNWLAKTSAIKIISTNSSSPSPIPTIPEFSLAIITLVVIVVVAGTTLVTAFRKRRKASKGNLRASQITYKS